METKQFWKSSFKSKIFESLREVRTKYKKKTCLDFYNEESEDCSYVVFIASFKVILETPDIIDGVASLTISDHTFFFYPGRLVI